VPAMLAPVAAEFFALRDTLVLWTIIQLKLTESVLPAGGSSTTSDISRLYTALAGGAHSGDADEDDGAEDDEEGNRMEPEGKKKDIVNSKTWGTIYRRLFDGLLLAYKSLDPPQSPPAPVFGEISGSGGAVGLAGSAVGGASGARGSQNTQAGGGSRRVRGAGRSAAGSAAGTGASAAPPPTASGFGSPARPKSSKRKLAPSSPHTGRGAGGSGGGARSRAGSRQAPHEQEDRGSGSE
jgi:hypothetical protein